MLPEEEMGAHSRSPGKPEEFVKALEDKLAVPERKSRLGVIQAQLRIEELRIPIHPFWISGFSEGETL
ncbi:MAG: hypothetical protein K9N21_15290 [Deltaproteobacteria bacterium]|nr:hypothetical protein [Deltaproteobacteria bacterium]